MAEFSQSLKDALEALKQNEIYTASAIRAKKGTTASINPQNFASEIESIDTRKAQARTVTPSTSQQIITPQTGYNCLSQVIVNGDSDLIAENIKKGVDIFGVAGTYEGGDDFNLKTRYQKAFSPVSTTTFKFTVSAMSTDTVELMYGAKTVTLGDGESAQIDIGASAGYYRAISVNCSDYVYELEISISNNIIMRINISASNARGFVLIFNNGYLYITSTEEIYVE